MKHLIFLFSLLLFCATADAQYYKKDGTPDMRYRENKEMYGNLYSSLSSMSSNYNNSKRIYIKGGSLYIQDGYMKKDGTYVAPHMKTKPDSYKWNNYKWCK